MLGLPMEIITMLISTIGSAYIRMKSDSQQDLANERAFRAGQMAAVREFQSPNTSWMRKAITLSFLGMAYFILFAPLFNLPTVVPIEVTTGLLFWKETVTEYITLEGMVTPEWLPHAIMSVVGFYFGNSMAKR
jgi:hypothetical protein